MHNLASFSHKKIRITERKMIIVLKDSDNHARWCYFGALDGKRLDSERSFHVYLLLEPTNIILLKKRPFSSVHMQREARRFQKSPLSESFRNTFVFGTWGRREHADGRIKWRKNLRSQKYPDTCGRRVVLIKEYREELRHSVNGSKLFPAHRNISR